MSLILEGIDLPKEGTVINLIVQSDGETQYITLGDGELIVVKEAQAIQIPKGHGAIKDGDAFIRHLQDTFCDNCGEHKKYGGVMCSTCHINDVILEYGDAPTILEAEEE